MAVYDQKITELLQHLVEEGMRVLDTNNTNGSQYRYVEIGELKTWSTRVRSLLIRVFGETSVHYRQFVTSLPEGRSDTGSVEGGIGVLRAAQIDYNGGYLFDMRELVVAEVFDDLSEQAKELLRANHFAPAAVVIGCVLEDALRKLCDKHGLQAKMINAMNDALLKADVYNKIAWRRVQTYGDIRNHAAHGEWDKFKRGDVDDMITGVTRFIGDHFG